MRKSGLIISIILALLILIIPIPKPVQLNGELISLTPLGQSMIALLASFAVLFATEALPTGLTVALVYAWLVFSGAMNSEEAGQVFSHEAAWFLVGALMIAQVLIKHNIHKRFLNFSLKYVNGKANHLLFNIILATVLLSGFLTDHVPVALLLPIVIAIVQMAGGFHKVPNLAKSLLLAIAFSSTLGGLITPSGAGRNILMIGFLDQFFNIELSYGTWMLMSLPVILVLIPLLTFTLTTIYPMEKKNLSGILHSIKKELKLKPMEMNEKLVIVIFSFVVFLWVFFSHLGIGMIALLGTLLFYIFGLARWRDYQQIHWGIPLLYFGAIGMGNALIETGAAAWLGAKTFFLLDSTMGIHGAKAITVAQSIFMSLYTQLMSDGAATASLAPILLESAKFSAADPIITTMAVALSSGFAFMLIIAAPANAIVYSTGFLKLKDFLKTGFVFLIISLTVLALAINFYWTGLLDININNF